MVFQDPYASLNPRMNVGQIIGEPLRFHRVTGSEGETRERIAELLDTVGLSQRSARRYPYEFSGGQRQRISIARALAVKPDFIVADEPISALDVNIQAQIINLMLDLQERFGLTYLFIAHDLAVVRHISDRVVVLYLGRVMEVAPAGRLFDRPLHPYTRYLLSAVPIPDAVTERQRSHLKLDGEPPSAIDPPSGLPFSHPLPTRQAHLCQRAAAPRRACAGPCRGLPFRRTIAMKPLSDHRIVPPLPVILGLDPRTRSQSTAYWMVGSSPTMTTEANRFLGDRT